MRLVTKAFKSLIFVVFLLLSSIIFYVFVALVCAVLPIKSSSHGLSSGLKPIYVCADYVHSDFIVPLDDTTIDWAGLFGLRDVAARFPDKSLAVGWGDYIFFTQVPTLFDAKPSIIVSAIAGVNPTALRVLVVNAVSASQNCTVINLDDKARHELAHYFEETLKPSDGSQPNLLEKKSDIEFYFSTIGVYSPWHTCNQWTSEGLKKVGLSYAKFAPFSFGVMWPLKKE